MTEHIVITRKGAVQIIRLNRPDKKNAITRAMYAAMTRALLEGDADDDVRVNVFLGVPGAFSSGNDMLDFMAVSSGCTLGQEVLDFLIALSAAKKPIVSGVDGLAIGIGTTIHLHCDLTFATEHALFRTPFVELGLVPEAASSLLVPPLMGHQKAFALLALGVGFDAHAALEAGLIYRVVDSSDLEKDVIQAAEDIAAKPPQAMQIARQLMRLPAEPVAGRIEREAKHFTERLASDEAQAAVMAFLTRKK